jgi:hypothetical protein
MRVDVPIGIILLISRTIFTYIYGKIGDFCNPER